MQADPALPVVGFNGRPANVALWAGAGIVALAAHVGVSVWFMHEAPRAPPAAPPPTIMIDLAPEPEAVATEETEISPDREVSEQSEAAEALEAPQDTPETPVETVAEAEPETAAPEPTRDEVVPAVEKVELPLPPLERPRPQKPRVESKRETRPERRQEPQAASRAAAAAQVQAPASNRTAAQQTSSSLSSASVSPTTWRSRLMAHLEKGKRYPAGARGERGVAYVRFSIDAAGKVLSASLAGSSGHPALDGEALSLVRRASPVPAPPSGANRTITAPVRFNAR
ncbi:energy transducer TonB [Methylopila sp. 73B]|uniref:energy transducer TonB family protein n=1 Tax=Methylopila sp. 73B TaxID=1120792 RepID=UPI000381E9B4|nr:energy transducer TonB [Methylopila sp. 73B]